MWRVVRSLDRNPEPQAGHFTPYFPVKNPKMAVSRLIHRRQQLTSFYLAALVEPDNRKTTIRLVCVFRGN
jgi:hypothetical protein